MKLKELFSQGWRFCISGGAGVIAGYITLFTLTEFAGLWYIFSAIIASIVNGGINFFLEKFWTFKNKDTKSIYKQAGWYASVRILLFFLDIGLLYILVEYFGLHYLIAQIIITVLLSIVSFICCRIIFRIKKS